MVETAAQSLVVLSVGQPGEGGDAIREALELPFYRLQSIRHLPTALARVAGGDVDVILLDLSHSQTEGAGLEGFLRLRAAAPGVAIIVLHDSADGVLAEQAVQAGAAGELANGVSPNDLCRAIESAVHKNNNRRTPSEPVLPRKGGKVISFIGAKGGVGATTVALNCASALARSNSVILAELRASVGSLSQYCRPQRLTRDVGHLLKMDSGSIAHTHAESCLWPYNTSNDTPGLRILFSPQTMEPPGDIGSDHANAISSALRLLADYVVFDLAASVTEPNRTILQASDILVLVVERDPVCVHLARLMIQAIGSWDLAPPLIGAVVVNRSQVASPIDMSEVESQLEVPIFGVIPPAADICSFAQKAHLPLTSIEPDGLAGVSLIGMADELARRIPVSRSR